MRFACVLALVVGAAAGCGGGEGTFAEGKITYRGRPLNSGSISFYFGNKPRSGSLMPDGRYLVPDLPLGEARVTVLTVSDPTMRPSPVLVPSKYHTPDRSPLKVTIQRGANTFDFDLKE